MYSGGAPFEGGSQLEDEEFNFFRDLAFSRLSGLVLEGFGSSVFASTKPPIHRLSGGVKIISDVFNRQSFLNELSKCPSDVGRQLHTSHPANKYETSIEIRVTLES